VISRHRTPAELPLDHLVVAAMTLDEGVEWIRDRLGAVPQAGGQHVTMGTHNALLRIGPRAYLEIIAIDPSANAPQRPRWMDLDEPRMRATLAEGPALISWAVRSRDIDNDVQRSPIDVGTIIPMQRGNWRWRLTVPDDGHLPGRGLVPILIEWADTRHPTENLPQSGVELVTMAGEHPEPAPIRDALMRLGLTDTLKVTYGRTPRLAAMLRTPRGVITL